MTARWWQNPLIIFSISWIVLMILVWEEVTIATALTVLSIIVVKNFNINLPQWVPKTIGFVLFALAFYKHGRFVNPEMGLNLLLAVVALKMLEAKEGRDWRMLTLGSFLLWATGALFVKTPLYFVCSIAGCLFALMALVKGLGVELRLSWRELLKWTLASMPLALILFFLLPRFGAGLWTPPAPPAQGEVGFSEEARPSDVSELQTTGAIAFHVSVLPVPGRHQLYWRGMTLTGHDGWNWYPLARDEDFAHFSATGRVAGSTWWQQDIIHQKAVRRAFGLDWPQFYQAEGKEAPAGDAATLRFPPYRTLRRYRAFSAAKSPGLPKAAQQEALIAGVKKRLPKELADFKPKNLAEAETKLAQYFGAQKFLYSLAPGQVPHLGAFMSGKRGWCAHYASATALTLRTWNIPARLVSGYLGGRFNPQGNYFTVSEDDAHVWVEAWDGERWYRIDPTLWIVPERLEFDGSEFYDLQNKSSWFDRRNFPTWYRDAQLWIEHINFRFLVWTEEFDREEQRSLAERLNWNLSSFYLAGLWVLLAAIVGYWGYEYWKTKRPVDARSLRLKSWSQYRAWLNKRGVTVSETAGIGETRRLIEAQQFQERTLALDWLDAWEKSVYQHNSEDWTGLAKRL